jgi:hypothetical protein
MATADEYAAWIVKNQSLKGTPDFDTVAKAYQEAKLTEGQGGIPGPRATPSTLDVATSAPYKTIAGVADLFINTPQNIANIAKMAYGTAMTAAGRPELAPNVTEPSQPVSAAFKRMGLIKPTEGMTTGQRILDVGLQAATGGAISPAASVREIGSSALKGLAAGTAGQTTTELTGSPVAGMAVAMATPTAITSAAQSKQARLQAEKARNAVQDLTIRAGQAENLVVTPGSVTPSVQNVLIERLAGKTRTQQEFSARNQVEYDRLARRAVGIGDADPLSRENMRQIRSQEYQKGYEPLNRVGAVQTDQQFNFALNNVLSAYTGPGRSFPNAIPQPVQDLVANYRVGQFNSADAIAATRTLREQANNNIRAGGDNASVGLAQRAISNALEDQIERSLQTSGNTNAQAMLEQFRASRQRMAISHAVEDAIVEGGGSINARQLANDLQTRGRYLSGDLDLIARFANIARPVTIPPNTSGTPGAGTMVVGGGLGAGVGSLIGGTQGATLGGMVGTFAPNAISYAARNYLASGMGQRRALPTYDRPINSLMATQPLNNALLSTLIATPLAP